ncbi:hypothetical protein RV18_GL001462 [Enterococcus termitis]|nr:hypothetical protein RV18_GL001462 [Enterococcus termitis]
MISAIKWKFSSGGETMYRIGVVNFEGDTSGWTQFQAQMPSDWELHQTASDEGAVFDLLILLENKPEQTGEICGQLLQLKKELDSLIWIWATAQNEMNRMVYLKLGADGVMTDHLKLEEWVLIVSNALRRKAMNGQHSEEKIVSKNNGGGLVLNIRNRSIMVNENDEIRLTNLEYKAMDILFQNVGETVTYEEIYKAIWGEKENEHRKVYRISNLIFHIRKKFEEEIGTSKAIRTVRSKGYVLTV